MENYEPQKIEEKWYAVWEKSGYFKADANSPKPPFCIVIPPPNVTGSLHMGHALNNTLQDILARHKRANGFNVLWLPGCDHAGIATQNVVERELKKNEGKRKHDLGREEFLKRVWEWKDKYGKTIMMQLRKLGSSLDWSRERFTMDEGLSNAVKEVFVRLYGEGLIYRGDYIVNWCPRCLTAISDIEVVHKDLNGHFYHIKYPFADGSGRFIQVATTRPETMLGDTAVAVHPDDPRYAQVPEGTMLVLPETGRKIPVIKDAYVDKEFGTGAVKITPAHDPNDFEIGLRHKLEVINVMNPDGTMNEKAGEGGKYKGLDRFKARKMLVEELEKQGLLPKIDGHKHAVGHCYRCDTVVEPYVSTQWFVKIKPLAKTAIDVVEKDEIRFCPDMWKKVYFEWMNNIKDWCISRQLWWGHRIPAWYCSCGEIIVAKETPAKCPKCGGTSLRQDEDVLDTWFSSALWPFSTLGWPEKTKDLQVFYPTTVLVTSWDILFFWVARMIMMGMKFMGKPPFGMVVINSLVTDAEGKKMSKSKGNVVDPLDILAKYSADALRFTMAALETQSRHISFAEERLKGYSNFMNKVWNASRFVIANAQGYKPVDIENGAAGLKTPEKWILTEFSRVLKQVTDDLEKYRFSSAALSIYDFFWHSFCDWYIEMAKIELNRPENPYADTVKTVLLKVLKNAIIMMHPVTPFITEEIYAHLPVAGKKDSIMLEQWPAPGMVFETPEMDVLRELIYHVRNLRGELGVSPAVKVKAFIKPEKEEAKKALLEYREIMLALSKAESIGDEPGAVKTAGRTVAGLGTVAIGIEGAVDVKKQQETYAKKLDNALSALAAVEKKVSDPNFAANAPKKVMDEEKAKIDKYKEEASKIKEVITMLQKVG